MSSSQIQSDAQWQLEKYGHRNDRSLKIEVIASHAYEYIHT